MDFSAERFAEIFAALGNGKSRKNEGYTEKRRADRLPHRATIRLIPYIEGTPREVLSAQVLDFSPRGIRVSIGRRIPTGGEFLVLLPRKGDKPVPILCNAVHVRALYDGRFSVGAEFVCVARDQVANLGQGNKELSRIRAMILE
ncbi:MAG: PilZ domain-containing protein [Tepidisphaeraceae bacterium]